MSKLNLSLKTIHKRTSVRTYSDASLEKQTREVFFDYLTTHCHGPFDHLVRFALLDVQDHSSEQLKSLGTYGMIRGAKFYLAGAVEQGAGAVEDFGYCMEGAILALTELGLGTCWLGGTLNRSVFAEKLGLKSSEILPAVTPVGFGAMKKSLKEKIVQTAIGARKRKDFDYLFYNYDTKTPITLKDAGDFAQILEAVRQAPSASNKQPWRIWQEKGKFHLFMEEDPAYNTHVPGVPIQRLDMGICMKHFELACNELNIPGKWVFQAPSIDSGKLIYIASWKVG